MTKRILTFCLTIIIMSSCTTTYHLISEKNIKPFNRDINLVKEGTKEIIRLQTMKGKAVFTDLI